jgi:hypothetical protein
VTDPAIPDPDEARARQPRQSTEAGRRRGRVLVPVVILAAFVLIFLIVVLVNGTMR